MLMDSAALQEKSLFALPIVEKVISDSPGLDVGDGASFPLSPEREEAARITFSRFQECDIVSHDKLRPMLAELQLIFDADQWERLVVSRLKQTQFEETDRCDLQEWLRFYGSIYASTNRYGNCLRKAAGRGDVETVKDLVTRGSDPRGCDGLGYSALHEAAQTGQLQCINVLCELIAQCTPTKKANVDVRDKHGWTPMITAAGSGHVKCLERLIQLGARVTASTDSGRTALHVASAKGRLDCVNALLKRGASQSVDLVGATPLHLAAQHGHGHVCKKLLARNDKLLAVEDAIGITPLDYQDRLTFWAKIMVDSKKRK